MLAVHRQLRGELLDARTPDGHWTGRLSSSALSTATAISALAVTDAARHRDTIAAGLRSIAPEQNDDGGFGDTDRSHSNIATSYLLLAADRIARQRLSMGLDDDRPGRTDRLRQFIVDSGAINGLRHRYGADKTFVVPILTNLAIAGLVPWKDVAALPFELAAVPRRYYAAVRMPVVSYAVPALVAIGQVRHHHHPTRLLPLRWLRDRLIAPTLEVLSSMQPVSGGYLEATPLTAFVLMSLASAGRGDTPVARRCVEFLVGSVRDDGQWPIDTNLATWLTSLAIEALSVGDRLTGATGDAAAPRSWNTPSLRRWHAACQWTETHRFTGSPPGGWGWTDLSGAVPDGDDTPAAVLATRVLYEKDPPSVEAGRQWLSQLQNRDGGLPTFCRGWGRLPFDRSSVDLTAHAIRSGGVDVSKAIGFLKRRQNDDGSFSPLWFGNQDRDDEDNPVYGTSRVLMAADRLPDEMLDDAVQYLLAAQNDDGGWGGGVSVARNYDVDAATISSVEETSLALEALAFWATSNRDDQRRDPPHRAESVDSAIIAATAWLGEAVAAGWHRRANPIGFYFAKLWYYEDLYPLIFATRAIGRVLQHEFTRTP